MRAEVGTAYPVNLVYSVLFSADVTADPCSDGQHMQQWEDHVWTICSVPGRVANAIQGQTGIVFDTQLDYQCVADTSDPCSLLITKYHYLPQSCTLG